MTPLLLFVVIAAAAFTQSVAGFGLGLIAVPLLVGPLGVPATTAMIGLLSFVTRVVLLIRYRQAMHTSLVIRMAIASALALPLGVLVLQRVDSPWVLVGLGVVVFSYALYALLNLHVPKVVHPSWAYGVGFLSGLLSGAYLTGGPPIAIYGTSREWTPDEFRGNFQGLGMVNTTLVVLLHFVAQDYTPQVWADFLVVLPALAIGLVLGIVAAPRINAVWFRRLVLVLLLAIGLNLIF